MPTLSPSGEFLYAAAYISGDEEILLRIYGIRLFDIQVALVDCPEFQLAFQVGHGFCAAMQIVEDFLDFAALLAQIPLRIPKGTQFPYANFMNSPFANIQYFSCMTDYFLSGFSQKPFLHVDTGLSFPFTIWAQLVVDAILKYKKSPLILHPPVPYNHTRVIDDLSKWSIDYPLENLYYKGAAGLAFERQTIPNQPFFYRLYCDSCRFWDNQEFSEEEQENSALFSHGIKIDSDSSRPYYYGIEGDNIFPYKSIEKIPGETRDLQIIEGWNYKDGSWRGYTSDEEIFGYPPENEIPENTPCTISPFMIAFPSILSLIRNYAIPQESSWSGKIDGSWRIGYGGIKIL